MNLRRKTELAERYLHLKQEIDAREKEAEDIKTLLLEGLSVGECIETDLGKLTKIDGAERTSISAPILWGKLASPVFDTYNSNQFCPNCKNVAEGLVKGVLRTTGEFASLVSVDITKTKKTLGMNFLQDLISVVKGNPTIRGLVK